MEEISIHPYRGYLNTAFSLKSNIAIDVVDEFDNSIYHLNKDENLQIRLKAGIHIFRVY